MPQLNSSTGQALRLQHNGGVEFGSPNFEGHPIGILQAHQFQALPAREIEFTCFAVRTMRLVFLLTSATAQDTSSCSEKNPQPDIRLFAET